MASTFSPITLSDDPRSWKAEIGLLNPDQTAVSFDSLNDLIRWLKTLSVDVDSNLTQLRALPKYGKLGKFEAGATSTSSSEQSTPVVVEAKPPSAQSAPAQHQQQQSDFNSIHAPPTDAAGFVISPIQGFVPTRRVRERVGGGSKQIASLFGGDEEVAPAPRAVSRSIPEVPQDAPPVQAVAPSQTNAEAFIPTRKVRQPPGGGSAQIAALFG